MFSQPRRHLVDLLLVNNDLVEGLRAANGRPRIEQIWDCNAGSRKCGHICGDRERCGTSRRRQRGHIVGRMRRRHLGSNHWGRAVRLLTLLREVCKSPSLGHGSIRCLRTLSPLRRTTVTRSEAPRSGEANGNRYRQQTNRVCFIAKPRRRDHAHRGCGPLVKHQQLAAHPQSNRFSLTHDMTAQRAPRWSDLIEASGLM